MATVLRKITNEICIEYKIIDNLSYFCVCLGHGLKEKKHKKRKESKSLFWTKFEGKKQQKQKREVHYSHYS